MATYGTLLTNTGARLIAQYLQEGGKLEITELAVGDGGGQEYRPTQDMTALRGERWRGPILSMGVSDISPNVIVIEGLVPAEVGGFTIREAGVFDARGNLIGVMNTPQTEKVAAVDGAMSEQHIQLLLAVSSTEAVELTVDPSLVLATKKEVAEAIDAHDGSGSAHGDIRAALAGKAEASALTAHNTATDAHQDIRTAIAAKPDSSAITAAVSAHNSASDSHQDLRTHLAGKANQADVPTKAEMNSALAGKANQTDLNSVKTTAENAASAASSAAGAASTAQTTANSAQSAASAAQTTANTANTTANNAVPKNAGAMTTNPAVGTQGVRNIYAGTGTISSLTTGAIYLQYE